MTLRGSVLVLGGGVGGVEASLDLAEAGFRAYLLDTAPSIGGVMAQLDKTFPTNDCSMCILSPKLVEADQHPNIEMIAYSELESLDGSPGDFTATIKRRARYVKPDKCTGCGACSEVCVLRGRVPDDFNMGLSMRSPIYVPFAQAVPRLALVDPKSCLRFTKGKCRAPCLDACELGAIDFDQTDTTETLGVGAVIIAAGAAPRDISTLRSYHPEHPNVVSSLEMERIMCASGPSAGRIIKPSDGKPAKSIAFIQCAGSRDQALSPYCSSVCCTYAIKEASVIKEHDPDIDCHIFHHDLRTFGKGFEQFRERAASEYKIRFTRFRIPSIEVSGTDSLLIRYPEKRGSWKEEEFDIVVLSVGLNPNNSQVAEKIGVQTDEYGFISTSKAIPVKSSKDGVFVIGTASAPKDIPETVSQASAAAAECASLLSPARGSEVEKKEYPPEIDVSSSEPRVGVFVCSCGKNIGAVVDVDAVVESAKSLEGVAHAEKNIYTCSSESCSKIRDAIKEHQLNRVVVAACTPRTHEPLFRETLREAGLNPYLFDMANIRDQCSWVHSGEPEKATEKAKGLVRMSVAKARRLSPLPSLPVKVTPAAIVIGGGPAGIAASLEIAHGGYQTFLVEKEENLGGNIREMREGATPEEKEISDWLKQSRAELEALENVEVFTSSEIIDISGYVGNFHATIRHGGEAKPVEAGVIVVATGGLEHKPASYLYGKSDKVVTLSELEERLSTGLEAQSIVIIQCVESREDPRPYCSRVCCISALNNAIALKTILPDSSICVLYRDIMAYGIYEDLYRKARELGVLFIRYDKDNKPTVEEAGEKINVKLESPDIPGELEIEADLLVLSTPVIPHPSNIELARKLKIPLDENGFFSEAHVKLRPVDFATSGIFLAGMAHYPKLLEEAISQGQAAAGRAEAILSKEFVMGEGAIAKVDPSYCRGCGVCEEVCEFSAITLQEVQPQILVANVNEALCVGCGMCAVACWSNAITMENFTDTQIESMIEASLESRAGSD